MSNDGEGRASCRVRVEGELVDCDLEELKINLSHHPVDRLLNMRSMTEASTPVKARFRPVQLPMHVPLSPAFDSHFGATLSTSIKYVL